MFHQTRWPSCMPSEIDQLGPALLHIFQWIPVQYNWFYQPSGHPRGMTQLLKYNTTTTSVNILHCPHKEKENTGVILPLNFSFILSFSKSSRGIPPALKRLLIFPLFSRLRCYSVVWHFPNICKNSCFVKSTLLLLAVRYRRSGGWGVGGSGWLWWKRQS